MHQIDYYSLFLFVKEAVLRKVSSILTFEVLKISKLPNLKYLNLTLWLWILLMWSLNHPIRLVRKFGHLLISKICYWPLQLTPSLQSSVHILASQYQQDEIEQLLHNQNGNGGRGVEDGQIRYQTDQVFWDWVWNQLSSTLRGGDSTV